jgi:hypothetical protein
MQNNVKYKLSEIKDDGVELKNGKENFELIALVDDVYFLLL